MIALLLDAGLPRGSALDLRARGLDVVHVEDLGLGSATDEAILAAAERDGRTVVTLDSDFAQLLFLSGAQSPSVVRFRIEGLDRVACTAWILRVIPLVEEELSAGAVVSVDHLTVRVRPLPTRRA